MTTFLVPTVLRGNAVCDALRLPDSARGHAPRRSVGFQDARSVRTEFLRMTSMYEHIVVLNSWPRMGPRSIARGGTPPLGVPGENRIPPRMGRRSAPCVPIRAFAPFGTMMGRGTHGMSRGGLPPLAIDRGPVRGQESLLVPTVLRGNAVCDALRLPAFGEGHGAGRSVGLRATRLVRRADKTAFPQRTVGTSDGVVTP